MNRLAELRAKRANVADTMNKLHQAADAEKRSFTADDDATWANCEAEIDKIDAEIRRHETLGRIGAPMPGELRAGGQEPQGDGQRGDSNPEEEYRVAFNTMLRRGIDFLDNEQRQLLAAHRSDGAQFRGLSEREQRAFAAGTGNVGGYTVPQDFRAQLEVALKAFGGMMGLADVMYTDTGATLPMPSFNYTGVKATIFSEGSASTADSSTPFSSVNLGAFTYRSPLLPVSYEFMQDSLFGEQYIIDALGRSLAWALNEHATTGDGSGKPRGWTIDAASGKVGTTGQTTTVIYDDLVDLVHAVDPAYRPAAKFQMHDSSIKVIRKIKDTAGRPIWTPSYDGGVTGDRPDRLLGFEIVTNQDMATMAANAKSIGFGDWKRYKIRIAKDVTLLRLNERYADQLQVAFLMFLRADARLLDAGTNPVKYYQNSAT